MMRGCNSQGEEVGTALMVVAASLMTVGIVTLASTGARLDEPVTAGWSLSTPFVRQSVVAIASCLLMVICSRIGPGLFRWRSGSLLQPSLAVFAVSLALLAMVWVRDIGVASHGRSRWLSLGPIGFQPSDVAKLAMVIFLASTLTRRPGRGAKGGWPVRAPGSRRRPTACGYGTGARTGDPAAWGEAPRVGGGHHREAMVRGWTRPGTAVPIIGLGLVCLMVGWEDFGTAVLLAAVGVMMLLVGGCRLRAVAGWSLPGLGGFAYLLFSHPYRVERFLAFLHLWDDPRGAGYHAIQSLAAIASGGWTGRGLGAGLAKYGYLPEGQSDFIFALICEETGVVGGAIVIALFVALMCLGLRAMLLADRSDGGFASLLAFGLTATVGLQAALNIAVVTVVAPTKGIGLPFVSAGGTSLLCFSAGVGLLAGVARRAPCDAGAVGAPEAAMPQRVDSPVSATGGTLW